MSEIKRHYVYEDGGTMGKGCYANEKDHQAALKQARIDAVREFAEWITKEFGVAISQSDADEFIEQLKEQGE